MPVPGRVLATLAEVAERCYALPGPSLFHIRSCPVKWWTLNSPSVARGQVPTPVTVRWPVTGTSDSYALRSLIIQFRAAAEATTLHGRSSVDSRTMTASSVRVASAQINEVAVTRVHAVCIGRRCAADEQGRREHER